MKQPRDRLLPITVPWMVCPSTPFLELHCFESGDSFVQLVACNKLLSPPIPSLPGTSVAIVSKTPDFRSAARNERGAYQLVRLYFVGLANARMSGAYRDSEVVDESQYDWSLVKSRFQKGENIQSWMDRTNAEWMRTGDCPDPGIYEVLAPEQSLTGSVFDIQNLCRFLVVGHDSYIEVSAGRFEIEYGQVLTCW